MRRLPPFQSLLLLVVASATVAGCARITDAPSLARRPAEAIDPRLPVEDRSATLPADPALAAALREIAEPAFVQARVVDAAIERADALASGAGAKESDSWIAAQQALSVAVAAQAPVTQAIGAFDAAVTERIASGQRLVPQDVAAVRAIAADLAALDQRHRAAIARVQAKLSR